ncbi:MAG: tRNA (guanine-N7-)-methyltransferase [Clostridiales bacterium]|jgi:tRNA (guanine-N7-)-methyltransferase|nr:tRNA (guanine-N7-)-methyltransferase [Clostridiales bacterium]MDN5282818.1 tRNA (guanine-N7-)-methyltransferase [Candidatus Ozemobacter sp.]
MGKKKLIRFAENKSFDCLIELDAKDLLQQPHELKGSWAKSYFKNSREIVLELGCGRGEYILGLSRLYPDKNFMGLDIKGSRLYFGAKEVHEANIDNAAFIRSKIDFIDRIFETEVDEIWLTFPDPFSGKPSRRLTSPFFLNRYLKILKKNGIVSLKTDDFELFSFSRWIARENGLRIIKECENLYGQESISAEENIKTTYEARFLAEGKNIHLLKFVLDREIKPLK